MDKCNKNDLLENFDKIPNKNHMWSMMRYISLVIDIYYNNNLELHYPRNSEEYFTYMSDKYWIKLIYGLLDTKTIDSIMKSIHNGNYINLIHWKPILVKKRYTSNLEICNEFSYYTSSYTYIVDQLMNINCNSYYRTNYYENKKIADIIFYIKDIHHINDDTCDYLLKYIIDFKNNDKYVINKFYKYLTDIPYNSSIETENKIEMINLINECY